MIVVQFTVGNISSDHDKCQKYEYRVKCQRDSHETTKVDLFNLMSECGQKFSFSNDSY